MIYVIEDLNYIVAALDGILNAELIDELTLEFPDCIFINDVMDIDITAFDEYMYDAPTTAIVVRVLAVDDQVLRPHINTFRDQLDESPVTMDGHSFDADQLSLRKMTDVANFVSNDQELTWTLADNTAYIFTGSAFKTIVDRVKKGQTKRSYYLHSHAKLLKERLPNVYESDLKQDLWPMDTTI